MKLKYSFIYICILGFLISKSAVSQTFFEKDSLNVFNKYDLNTYLVCDAKMNVPELARKIGFKKVSYKATFDIIDYNPQNINIICLDTSEIWFDDFRKATLSNIQQLEFIKDTSAYSLIFNYNFSKAINSDYIDFSNLNRLEMYFKTFDCAIIEDLSKHPLELDTTNKTIKFFTTFETNKILKHNADILVERIFSDGKDSVTIIKNNLPYFENDIKRIAQSYTKEYIDKKLSEANCSFIPKHYFINFNIVTIPKQCGCK
ncbi:MAG: hypothetical protein WAR59_04705 [Ignavibacteriaceae bacterium]